MKIETLYKQIRDGKIKSDIELQREIIYDPEKQAKVIDSIVNDIPLPAFYFWKNKKGILEVLDGKQRIEAIKNFIENNLQYNGKIWNESQELQKKINETNLLEIICEGKDGLKREIFNRINTLGVPLSNYEVLNGLFHGEYLRGLTTYSSDKDIQKILKTNSRGKHQYKILQLLMRLKNRPKNTKSIYQYIDENQKNSFDDDLRKISKYIKFIRQVFDNYKELDIYFGLSIKYINDLGIWKKNKDKINEQITIYLKSDDSKLTDKAKEIKDIIMAVVENIRTDPKRLFTKDDKDKFLKSKTKDSKGKYKCNGCNNGFFKDELEMDHSEKPWSKGGRTVLSNAEILCKACNIAKLDRENV